ncbi:MAG: C-GCAxxG-C-C family protein, partial [Parabacteroides sp.]
RSTRNYAEVQRLAGAFKEKFGTIICRELLSPADAAKTKPTPDTRTKEYYMKRPCGRFVIEAARLVGEMLQQ